MSKNGLRLQSREKLCESNDMWQMKIGGYMLTMKDIYLMERNNAIAEAVKLGLPRENGPILVRGRINEDMVFTHRVAEIYCPVCQDDELVFELEHHYDDYTSWDTATLVQKKCDCLLQEKVLHRAEDIAMETYFNREPIGD